MFSFSICFCRKEEFWVNALFLQKRDSWFVARFIFRERVVRDWRKEEGSVTKCFSSFNYYLFIYYFIILTIFLIIFICLFFYLFLGCYREEEWYEPKNINHTIYFNEDVKKRLSKLSKDVSIHAYIEVYCMIDVSWFISLLQEDSSSNLFVKLCCKK